MSRQQISEKESKEETRNPTNWLSAKETTLRWYRAMGSLKAGLELSRSFRSESADVESMHAFVSEFVRGGVGGFNG